MIVLIQWRKFIRFVYGWRWKKKKKKKRSDELKRSLISNQPSYFSIQWSPSRIRLVKSYFPTAKIYLYRAHSTQWFEHILIGDTEWISQITLKKLNKKKRLFVIDALWLWRIAWIGFVNIIMIWPIEYRFDDFWVWVFLLHSTSLFLCKWQRWHLVCFQSSLLNCIVDDYCT